MEISSLLNLSEGTVKNYLSDIYKELDVSTRIEAANLFRKWISKEEQVHRPSPIYKALECAKKQNILADLDHRTNYEHKVVVTE